MHNLTFTADDGSGDKEIRAFVISAPKVEIKGKGTHTQLRITTRNDGLIKILFSAAETAKIWASAFQCNNTTMVPLNDFSRGVFRFI